MSATPEFETTAGQDYGPASSSENIYEQIFDHKLTNMNIPSIRTPVLRAVPLSPGDGVPEPDSTNPENILHSVRARHVDKDTEYNLTENECSPDGLPISSISSVVRIEETTLENVSHIAYPVIQETDDATDAGYVDNSNTTLIHTPLNTALVQNVTKLPQNFTINVDASVGNITTLQNVTQEASASGQTLWLPTILATGPTQTDSKSLEEDRPQAGVSQIIITSENYVSNDPNQAGSRRTNIIADASYISRTKPSKVQILSNISLTKTSTYSQQYVTPNGKEASTQLYTAQNHVYKLNTNIVPQKHLNNSVLCTKPPKSQSLISCPTLSPTVVNNNPMKNISYGHTFSKTSNVSKCVNKVNNGANLNTVVAVSSGNSQCHVLSRVVSAPNKVSVHSTRKSAVLKSSKSSTSTGPLPSSQPKSQSRAIKIIQQTGTTHKTEGKNWSLSNASYKNQSTYGVVESNSSKVIQKVGSPAHKNQQSATIQKVATKSERLVLQSPCGPVLISTAPLSTTLPKPPHYVQAGPTPNLRYVHTYSSSEPGQHSNISQVTANQQLTAQILQSLSQPKLMLASNNNTAQHIPHTIFHEEMLENKCNQKRVVYGDPSTLLTADDIIGMEERPNIAEELIRYSFQALAFVMLDHTYAEPIQKLQAVSSPNATVMTGLPVVSPTQVVAPQSPVKGISPITTNTAATYELQPVPLSAPVSTPCSTVPATIVQLPNLSHIASQDDDNASVISSVEGDRQGMERTDRAGSDTETAPEGEEEEGKTRCICGFTHDDGYMICCDRCGEWQHVDCMGVDRQNIPDKYMCELCQPRAIDRRHARAIQLRKREELSALGAASDSDSSETGRTHGPRRKRLLTVTTYTNTSGTCVTTYNSNMPLLPPLPTPSPLPNSVKRGPKRPKKSLPVNNSSSHDVRKSSKRKLSDKRVKRKKDIILNRGKYNSNVSNQAHWQEYEQAMTNHYSPELRAKVMKYSSKLGSSPSMASAITAILCTTVPHAGGKILIATRDLKENTPIIELRGKYMLSNQHRPQPQNSSRAGSQKPGPFVFFYKLPKDNTQICIDTRTYGNEARFVRRSCKPNAELQHCIVKGALHIYLVTIGIIQSNTEITVGHDSNSGKQPCACGNPKHCKVNGITPLISRKSCDYPPREKRIRNRCSSSSSPVSPPAMSITPSVTREQLPPVSPVKSEKKSPVKNEVCTPLSPVKITNLNFDDLPIKKEPDSNEEKQEIDLYAKEEIKEDFDEIDSPQEESNIEAKSDATKISPENIKNDFVEVTIPKVEDVKPDSKPEVSEEKEVKTENGTLFSDEEKPQKHEELKSVIEEEKSTRSHTSAKSACHDRSSRSSRNTCFNQDSLDDKTDDSQDRVHPQTNKDKKKMTREERKMEAIMKAFERMEKAEQRKQEVKERQKRRESDPVQSLADRDQDDDEHVTVKKRKRRKGRARTVSQSASNRRRLNSADSDMVTSGDEAPAPPSPVHAPIAPVSSAPNHMHTSLMHDLDEQDHPADTIPEDLGVSSACLLVEAAVGSVESAFKLPKTKKTMATEWVGRSPERTPSPYRSPYRPSLVSAPSLESLVQVASTIIGDLSGGHSEHEVEMEETVSPPRTPSRDRSRPPKKAKRVTRSTPPVEATLTPATQHSAKKRWLRQAISEESDSPTAGVCHLSSFAESPPNEMVTPLKKRRLARESLSCEQSSLVVCHGETSPNFTSEDSPVKDDCHEPIMRQLVTSYKARNIMDTMYSRDRSHSESGHGSDDQCNLDSANDVLNVNLKVPHDSENIRRIIGVPGSEDIEPKTSNQLINMDSTNNDVIENISLPKDDSDILPMEIELPVTVQTKICNESNDSNSDLIKETGSPNEKQHSSHSADTSGNSSPQRDEMDDIQKKIHSFHTENILILKSRNKKPPKEKRKKVNLNFDLNMVDDQISIQLRTENDTSNSKSPDINGDLHDDLSPVSNSIEDIKLHYVSMENIPLPPVESIPLPATENIPLPDEPSPSPLHTCIVAPETIPLPEESVKLVKPLRPATLASPAHMSDKVKTVPNTSNEKSSLENSSLSFSSRFSSTGLFSGIFNNMNQSVPADNQINDNVPNMQLIKSAIDRTTSLDKIIFSDKETLTPVDELKSVQEILTRVNNMGTTNSVIISDVLKGQEQDKVNMSATVGPVCGGAATATGTSASTPGKSYCSRNNDPRLNPPPLEKPKPVRRKLSISEYRKRLKGGLCSGSAESETGSVGGHSGGAEGSSAGGDWSSESSLSPLRLDAAAAAAADDLEQRLHRALNTTPSSNTKGMFDAQPTQLERQRENLSERLRREFGLALPEDDEARPATALQDSAGESGAGVGVGVGVGAGAGAGAPPLDR